eukprot:118492-Rhodomonas_salina.1
MPVSASTRAQRPGPFHEDSEVAPVLLVRRGGRRCGDHGVAESGRLSSRSCQCTGSDALQN